MGVKIVFTGPLARTVRDQYIDSIEAASSDFVQYDNTVSRVTVDVDWRSGNGKYPCVDVIINTGDAVKKLFVWDNAKADVTHRTEYKIYRNANVIVFAVDFNADPVATIQCLIEVSRYLERGNAPFVFAEVGPAGVIGVRAKVDVPDLIASMRFYAERITSGADLDAVFDRIKIEPVVHIATTDMSPRCSHDFVCRKCGASLQNSAAIVPDKSSCGSCVIC